MDKSEDEKVDHLQSVIQHAAEEFVRFKENELAKYVGYLELTHDDIKTRMSCRQWQDSSQFFIDDVLIFSVTCKYEHHATKTEAYYLVKTLQDVDEFYEEMHGKKNPVSFAQYCFDILWGQKGD